jgi:hypothetical protein
MTLSKTSQPLTPHQRAALLRRIDAAQLAEFHAETEPEAGAPVSEGTSSAQTILRRAPMTPDPLRLDDGIPTLTALASPVRPPLRLIRRPAAEQAPAPAQTPQELQRRQAEAAAQARFERRTAWAVGAVYALTLAALFALVWAVRRAGGA